MKQKQTERVLDWLKTRGELTTREAVMELNIMSLPKRIEELRRSGHAISTTYRTKPERGKIRRLSAGGLGGNQMANKYRVKVSYISFMFEDRNEAIDFAETAFDKMVDENRGVEISIVRADEEVEA